MASIEEIKKQEDRIQQEIVMDYNNTYCRVDCIPRCLIFHIPNQNQYNLVSIGVLAGVSDLIIVHQQRPTRKGVHIYMEVKTPTGTQSPKQIAFMQRIIALGYEYYIVRSKEDARVIIQAVDAREAVSQDNLFL